MIERRSWRQHGNAFAVPQGNSDTALSSSTFQHPLPVRSVGAAFPGAYEPLRSLYHHPYTHSVVPSADAQRGVPSSTAAPPSAVASANTSTLSFHHASMPSQPPVPVSHLVNDNNLVHSRSVADVAYQHTATREQQPADDQESLRSVNVNLQREISNQRHEIQRLRVDNSRLHDQVGILSAQESFLRTQLEKVVQRQQELLQFERTPEGQGHREVLEQQNNELRQLVEAKEHELSQMQRQWQETLGRLRAAEDVLHAERATRRSIKTDMTAHFDSPPETSAVADALINAAHTYRAMQALRHVVLTPHSSASAFGWFGDSVESGADTFSRPCSLTQRHCATKCLRLAGAGRSQEPAPVRKSLREAAVELAALTTKTYELVVSTSVHLQNAIHEDELAAMSATATLGSLRHADDALLVERDDNSSGSVTAPLRGGAVHQSVRPTQQKRSSSAGARPFGGDPSLTTASPPRTANSTVETTTASDAQRSPTGMYAVPSTTREGGISHSLRVERSSASSTFTGDSTVRTSRTQPLVHPPRRSGGPQRGGHSTADTYGGCEQQ